MHKPISVILLASAFLTFNTFAQKTPRPVPAGSVAAPEARLPIRRVVLYKNGVGYFEHSERVHGNRDLHIDFTTAQLNDVLKSLTVVDLGGGRITAVRFNSVAPLGERLKALHLPLGEATSHARFLEALRGTRVAIRSGREAATGRVLSVEARKKIEPKGGEVTEVLELSLVTDSGDLRSFEVGPGTSVRVEETQRQRVEARVAIAVRDAEPGEVIGINPPAALARHALDVDPLAPASERAEREERPPVLAHEVTLTDPEEMQPEEPAAEHPKVRRPEEAGEHLPLDPEARARHAAAPRCARQPLPSVARRCRSRGENRSPTPPRMSPAKARRGVSFPPGGQRPPLA